MKDGDWTCPVCGKTATELRKLGKTVEVDGTLQCADCNADLDCASPEPLEVTEGEQKKFIQSLVDRSEKPLPMRNLMDGISQSQP